MKKVLLFTSSILSFAVINQLIEKRALVGVVVTPIQDPNMMNIVSSLQRQSIPLFQHPENDDPKFIEVLKNLGADIAVVFTYPKILSQELFSIFPEGCFNIHPSPLPKYRGPQPLYWQILNKEEKSAVTLHALTAEVDGGDILFQQEFSIDNYDTLGSLANKTAQLAPLLVEELLNGEKNIKIKQKDHTINTKPTQKELTINWNEDTADLIAAKAKAGNPMFGGVQSSIKNEYISILEATAVSEPTFGVKEGKIVIIGKEGLVVATKNGAIRLDIISTNEGVFSGYRYAISRDLNLGDKFINLI